jgi:prevent-host-death family protein
VKTVGAYEAKTHLAQLLDEVAAGESITITRRGVPVAELVPPTTGRAADVGKLIEEWREYRKRRNLTLGGLSIREMVEEGRRF